MQRKLQTTSEISSIGSLIASQILDSKLSASLMTSSETLGKLNNLESRIGRIESELQKQREYSERQRLLRETVFQIRSFIDDKFQILNDGVVRYVVIEELIGIVENIGLSTSALDEIQDKKYLSETMNKVDIILTTVQEKDKVIGNKIIKSQNMLNKLRTLFSQMNTQLANIQTGDTQASTIGSIILVLISGCNFTIYYAVSEETTFYALGIISALISIPFIWGWIKYTLKKQDMLEDLSSRVRGLGLTVGYPWTQKGLANKLQSSIKQHEQEMESILQKHPEFALIEVKI